MSINREALERPFDAALIRTRKGPSGHSFSYVEGAEYIRRLNVAFDGEWSLSVEQHIIRDNEVIVLVKLIAAASRRWRSAAAPSPSAARER